MKMWIEHMRDRSHSAARRIHISQSSVFRSRVSNGPTRSHAVRCTTTFEPPPGIALYRGSTTIICSAADVRIYVAKDADMSRYKTYQWLPTRVLSKSGILEDDPNVGAVLRRVVNEQLVKQGLTEANGRADLQVSVVGLREASAQLEAIFFSAFPDTDWGTAPIATMGRFNYEGALGVNLIDTTKKKTVWAGVSRKAIKSSGATQGDVDKAADRLFKKFPK